MQRLRAYREEQRWRIYLQNKFIFVPALFVKTHLMFGELLEPVFPVDIVLHMVRLVLLNVALVLERELAARPSAMKVRRLLSQEGALWVAAVLRGPVALESVAEQRCVLFVEVFVSEYVRRTGVHFVAPDLPDLKYMTRWSVLLR